jgi:hypothetical protein
MGEAIVSSTILGSDGDPIGDFCGMDAEALASFLQTASDPLNVEVHDLGGEGDMSAGTGLMAARITTRIGQVLDGIADAYYQKAEAITGGEPAPTAESFEQEVQDFEAELAQKRIDEQP